MTDEPIEYPDDGFFEAYRDASFQHAESHYEAGSDPEFCEDDECPHWPNWWLEYGEKLKS